MTLYCLIEVLDVYIIVTAKISSCRILVSRAGQDRTGLGWADLGWWGSKGWMSINSGSWLRVTQALTLLPWWQALNLILVSTNSHPECFSNLIEGKSTVSSSFGFEKVLTLVLIRKYYLLCMHFPLFMWQRRGLVYKKCKNSTICTKTLNLMFQFNICIK